MRKSIVTSALALLAVCASNVFGQSLLNFRSDTGWIAFAYPPGWDVIPTDRSPSRFLENYAIQPHGQSFSGRAGEIAIRIFDPMYVIEQARSRPDADPATVFQRFVQSIPGGQSASFSNRFYSGRSFLFASAISGGFEADYLGFVNEVGDLDVLAMALNPSDAARFQPILFQIAGTVRTAPTAGSADAPASAVRSWYNNLRSGNAPGLAALTCRQALPAMLLYFADPDILRLMTAAARSFDMKGLRFQTIKVGSAGAAVRISGNLVAFNGTVSAVYENNSMSGGSNVLFANYEDGAWHVCGPVRGGTR